MKTYVLNLPSCQERLADFQADYPSSLLPYEVWVAKTSEEIEIPDWWHGTPGMASNRQNFIDLFSACADGTEEFLIFEDDCVFSEDFATRFPSFLETVPADWEYLNLGPIHLQNTIYFPRAVVSGVLRPALAVCTHALLVRPSGAAKMRDALLDSCWGCKHITDQKLALLFFDSAFRGYSPVQPLCGQRGGFSTLRNCILLPEWGNAFRYINLADEVVKTPAMIAAEEAENTELIEETD